MVAVVMVDAVTGLWPQVEFNVKATITGYIEMMSANTGWDAEVWDTTNAAGNGWTRTVFAGDTTVYSTTAPTGWFWN